tara:strand:- start:1241 stop:3508 length:2268 start_codon:yes stop_codon:yes gene_type:complete
MKWTEQISKSIIFRKIFYFFPIQLIFVHLKNNPILVGIWLLIIGFTTRSLAEKYGVPFLFLSPEYLGDVSFLSYLIVGFSFGGFLMAFNISSYIMNGHRFPFIATIGKPFLKYCINNLFWSGSLIVVYIVSSFNFLINEEDISIISAIYYLLGFIVGLTLMFAINFLYFKKTNKDLHKVSGGKYKTEKENPIKAVFHKKVNWEDFFNPDREWRIETYLSHFNKVSIARSTEHYDKSMLKQVFEQNHLNAALFEIIVFASIICLSFGSDIKYFTIPAGASLLLMFTMFIMVTSAIHSWFRGWAPAVMIALFLCFNYVSKYDYFNPPSKAYGLNYDTKPAEFSTAILNHNINPENFRKDFLHTIQILENWRRKNNKNSLKRKQKPKLIFINTTGGGMRSALWSYHATQYCDSVLNGELFKHTQLISGSSGGLVGLSYLRELYLRKSKGQLKSPISQLSGNMAKDVLNKTTFAWTVNDLIFKFQNFKDGEYEYKKDRGYAFEQQLNENTNNVLDKRIYEYYTPEFKSEIPMLIINPTIVNNGKRLIISPQPTSYLSYIAPQENISSNFLLESIEFKRFFKYQDAKNLKFTSALRMSSTFPYIMPIVNLPSNPVMEVMDAGIRDNFGTKNSMKFLYTFRNWIETNTSGVIFIQIRDAEKKNKIEPNTPKTFIESISSPVSNVYKNLFITQDYDHDQLFQYTSEWFEGKVDVIDLVLDNNKKNRLSLSWHLTESEKKRVYNSINRPDNQESISRLKQLLE